MYRIEWIKKGVQHSGKEIEDLERADYLAQEMMHLTGVKHLVEEV